MADKKLRIAIDADDTIMDQASLLATLLSWKFDKEFKRADFVWNFFVGDPALDKAFWGLYTIYDNSYLRRAMSPTDNHATGVIKDLQDAGQFVEIVTRNSPDSVKHIKNWLFMHGVENIRVRAIGRPKSAGDSAAKKAKLNYDIFVDDSPTLVEPILKSPSKRLILYSQPWNKQVPKAKNVFRANDWLEVRKILRALGALDK